MMNIDSILWMNLEKPREYATFWPQERNSNATTQVLETEDSEQKGSSKRYKPDE
jgi:hypothetical protein